MAPLSGSNQGRTTGRFLPMAVDPHVRGQLAKEGRLWLLSLVCAAAGATGVYLTGSVGVGVLVFLGFLVVLGGLLLGYEKRRRR